MLLLRAEEISKRFGETQALSAVNFELEEGEVHALIGQNGAGKSTFSRIIAGDIQKDKGRIFIRDEEINIRNCFFAREIGISMIYQELKLVPYITVAENIFINKFDSAFAGIINWRSVYNKTLKLLKMWDLKIDPKSIVSDLSIANQQLIEIMRSLALNPNIIIMDEPTSSLGFHEIQSLFKLINSLRKQKISIIYISHVLEEVFQIADRITVFRDGKNRSTVKRKDVTPNEVIKEMLGKSVEYYLDRSEKNISGKKILLEAINISKKNILNNVNLQLKEGEIIGITGLVGSGKTELANCLSGLLQIDKGKILINGKEKKLRSIQDGIKNSIGLIPEDRRELGIFGNLPVRENITIIILRFLSKLGFISRKKEKNIVDEYSSLLKIKYSTPEEEVDSLSGGNQQKIVIARWLSTKPKILIADEPTRGVDIGTKREIHKLFKEIVKAGAGVIIFLEDIEELLAISDRIIIMKNKSIIKSFEKKTTPHEVILSLTGG